MKGPSIEAVERALAAYADKAEDQPDGEPQHFENCMESALRAAYAVDAVSGKEGQ